jgi:hypothetical protein
MTTSRFIAGVLLMLVAGQAPVTMAQSRARTGATPEDEQVLVIRGTEQGAGATRSGVDKARQAPVRAQQEQGVTVMRPDPDGFMRDTQRLAAEAEAREDRAAREEARDRDRQLTRTLKAVEDAAREAEQEARTRQDRYYPVYVPARPQGPPPPK